VLWRRASRPLSSFEFDLYGNVVRHTSGRGVVRRYLDAAGRLRGVERPGASYAAALSYDPAGYRRERSEADPQGLEVSLYLEEWLEIRTGGARHRLVHAPGIDNVLAEVEEPLAGSPTTRQLLPDGAGSVVGVATGTGVTKRRFEAFGALRSQSGALPVERGFAGRPTEGETGLLYLRARHYDPATGQFLQVDPLGILSDHPYAYAAGNPIVFRDPFGLTPGESELQTGVDSMSAEAEAGEASSDEEGSSDASSTASIEARAQTPGALGNAARLATGTYAGQSQRQSTINAALDEELAFLGISRASLPSPSADFRFGSSGGGWRFVYDPSLAPDLSADLNPGSQLVRVGPRAFVDPSALRSTIAHELQHVFDSTDTFQNALDAYGDRLSVSTEFYRHAQELRGYAQELRYAGARGLAGGELQSIIGLYQKHSAALGSEGADSMVILQLTPLLQPR